MNLKPEELEKNGYILIDELLHNDLTSFLTEKNKEHKSYFLTLYFIFFILPISIFSFLLTKGIISGEITVVKSLLYCLLGVLSVLLFAPIHELLHALAYKLIGANNISYFANLKKFYLATVSDKNVLNVKEFKIVALLPFVFVLVFALFLSTQVDTYGMLWLLSFVFTHNMFCGGDFSFLNYMEVNKHKGIVTFDDKEKGKTYFYIKVKKTL